MTDKQLTDKAIKFKGSDYVQVKDRVLYLADKYEWKYSIETDYQYYPESKMWVVKAKLTLNGCVYNWLAQELEWSSFINKTSALENAETSAVGRACAMAWIGVIDSIASMDEINKANNRASTTPDMSYAEKTAIEQDWFEKAKQSVKFMQECLDEEDFIRKVKSKHKPTKQQETDLRICYKNAKAMENIDLPFWND